MLKIDIPNYKITELIHENRHLFIYKALNTKNGSVCILKVLKDTAPPQKSASFKHEYDVLKKLQATDQIKCIEIKYIQKYIILVLEYFEGQTLKKYINDAGSDIIGWLPVCINIVEGIRQIHEQHIVHKDIKPENILVNSESKKIKIIDFEISSFLEKETSSSLNADLLEGTLAYISPEQTGRLNRPIDSRTDFYSCGVMFYELFTGSLPFEANNSMELIHAHIAKEAKFPSDLNPLIPKGLSEVIMKCLAKDPEKRYKSAYGLKKDLEECYNCLMRDQTLDSFTPGLHDEISHFKITQRLFGREKEIIELNESFAKVLKGKTELLIVSGYSGVGKSFLVNELQQPVAKEKGHFINGKFDQYKRNLALHGIIEALNKLIAELLLESDDVLCSWSNRIQDALGVNTAVITEYIPDLKHIIKNPLPLENLDPHEAENRFLLVFSNFVQLFADQNNPLVMVLDDMQWADMSTIKLLEYLATEAGFHHLLFVITFRDNEIDASHPLKLMIDRIAKEKFISHVHIEPLTPFAVNQLVAASLHLTMDESLEISQVIHKKTNGNPFFINQFLKNLHQDGLVYFDPTLSKWAWKLDEIRKIGVMDNVADLMSLQLQKLTKAQQKNLQVASAIGYHFDSYTLSKITQQTFEETEEHLFELLRLELINQEGRNQYIFAHDRIQQAAYQLIDNNEKNILHYQIGKSLLETIPKQHQNDFVIDIVNQLNYGSNVLNDLEEKQTLCHLNHLAGKKAQDSGAYSSAVYYYRMGIKNLTEQPWYDDYKRTFSLYFGLAICEQLAENLDEATRLFEYIIENSPVNKDKALTYSMRIHLYHGASKHEKEIFKWGKEALKLLNINFVERPNFISRLLVDIKTYYYTFTIKEKRVESLPLCHEEDIALVANIFCNLFYYVQFSRNLPLVKKLAVDLVHLSLKHGLNEYSSAAFSCLALGIYMSEKKFNYAKPFMDISFALRKRFPKARSSLVMNTYAYEIVLRASDDFNLIISLLKENLQIFFETGQISTAGLCQRSIALRYLIKGVELSTLQQETKQLLARINKHKSIGDYLTIGLIEKFCENMLEVTYKRDCRPDDYVAANLMKISEGQRNLLESRYLIYQIMLHCFFEEYEQAYELTKIFNLNVYFDFTREQDFFIFFKGFLIACTQKNDGLEQVKAIVKHIRYRKKTYTAKYYDYHLYLLQAEIERIGSNTEQAILNYKAAIHESRKNEYRHLEGLALDRLANFYNVLNDNDGAAFYMQKCIVAYSQWEAKGLVSFLQKKYKDILQNVSFASSTHEFNETTTTSTQSVDYNTIITASQVLSKEINLENLMGAMMLLVIQNAGADKACLLLNQHDELLICAEIDASEGKPKIFSGKPLDKNSEQCSIAILNYVIHSNSVVLLHDVNESLFAKETYIQKTKPLSLLCLPIVQKNHIVGILYLENHLIKGAFTNERVKLLTLLSSQMAISLENAHFYATLENKVQIRTQELNEKNSELEQALNSLKKIQEELIQKEKLASMGVLVSGIAHELQNPLNFIINFSEVTKDCAEELYTKLKDEILVHKEEIEEIVTSIQDSVQVIEKHGFRIALIIKEMLAHSNIGKNQKQKVDLAVLIKQAIDYLKNQYLDKFKCEIIFNKGSESFTAQAFHQDLFASLIKILDNSLWAMQEKAKTITYNPKLEINLTKDNKFFAIEIIDNGIGVSVNNLSKVFQPFFTTKPTGVGVGLGLSITYDIITKEHGGELRIDSVENEYTKVTLKLPCVQTQELAKSSS